MTVNQKPSGRAASMPAGLLTGTALSLGITLLLAALAAWLVLEEVIEETHIGYCVMVILMAASFLGALTACGRIKRQRLLVCMLSGSVYFLLLMSITALFFGGQYEAVGVTGILVFGGSMLAVLSSGSNSREGKRRKRRLRNR